MIIDFEILRKIGNKFGDSFYILDTNRFESNYNELLNSFKKLYSKTVIGYSYKTNYTPVLCSKINELGGYAEVVSEMEYDLARKIGVKPEKIIVNGPYKTEENLRKYFINGSIVNIDSQYEIDLIKKICEENKNHKFRLGFRCNFQVSDKYVSRFGFDISSKDFQKNILELESYTNIDIEGIHCHYPDRILDLFETRVEKMLGIAKTLFKSPPAFIDIGGGYFGKMPDSLADQFQCNIPLYSDYARVIAGAFDKFYHSTKPEQKPHLIIEPGSAIVADTMKFVAKIMDIKKIDTNYIAICSGSKFNMGAFASTITMPAEVHVDPGESNSFYESVDISGFTCIESDYLIKKFKGIIGRNSFIVFDNVGSYSIVFKPPFIHPNVPIIEFGNDNNSRVIKRKENFEDIFTTFNFN